MMPTGITISVIIPFKNAAATLEDALGALADQEYSPTEIILVDNGSSDISGEIAHRFIECHGKIPCILSAEKKPGAAATRNKGASLARGEWLAFTDADCIPESGWLKDLAHAISENSAVGGFAGTILPLTTGTAVTRFLGLYTLPRNPAERTFSSYSVLHGGGFPTANFCCRKDLFDSIGGFDETRKISGEDHDFCARMYASGHTIKALTSAKVKHRHRGTVRGLIRQAYGFGFSHGYCLKLCPGNTVIVNVPALLFEKKNKWIRMWIDWNQADKKMATLALLALLWPILTAVVVLYFAYLCTTMYRRARRYGIPVAINETPLFAVLLLTKSLALSCGRIAGAIKNRVLCI